MIDAKFDNEPTEDLNEVVQSLESEISQVPDVKQVTEEQDGKKITTLTVKRSGSRGEETFIFKKTAPGKSRILREPTITELRHDWDEPKAHEDIDHHHESIRFSTQRRLLGRSKTIITGGEDRVWGELIIGYDVGHGGAKFDHPIEAANKIITTMKSLPVVNKV